MTNELVIMNNQQAVTTSLKVAESFGKQHKHVLESINTIIEGVAEKSADLFKEDLYEHPQNKQKYKMYYMNRDGFTLLAMGFTGKQALDFKLKYIEAFNKMEQQLQELNKPSYMIDDPIKRAEQWILEQQEKQRLELEKKHLTLENTQQKQLIGELKPKADYTDIILKSTKLLAITQIAKDYGMSGQAMNDKLHKLGIQYKQSGQWLLYSKYHDKGYTNSSQYDYFDNDGNPKTKLNTKWTQKGRLFSYTLLKSKGIIPTIEKEVI